LASDESRASGGAALLAVIIGEEHPLLADRIDVGRAVSHQSVRVGADIRLADIVAPNNDNIGLRTLLGRRFRHAEKCRHNDPNQTKQGEFIDLPAHEDPPTASYLKVISTAAILPSNRNGRRSK
jgi:hypothetical protein